MIGLSVFLIGVVLLRLLSPRASADQRRTWTGQSGRFLVAWILAGPAWLACLALLLRGQVGPTSVGLGLLTTIVLFPWPLTRAVLIPLGLPRTAWWLARLADITWGRDPQGGAAVAAVLAAARGRQPTAGARAAWQRLVVRHGDLVFARERVQRLDLLGAAGATAAALLADLDGDEARGDAIADAIHSFDPEVVPMAAARILAERALMRLGYQPSGRRAAILALDGKGSSTVGLVQALLRREETPGLRPRLACLGWWILAPRRSRTWSLLRGRQRVLAPEPASTPVAPRAVEVGLAHAARRHLELRAGSPAIDDVIELARAWEAALPPALEHLRQRAVALKVDGDAVGHDLRATVLSSLRHHLDRLDLGAVDLRTLPPLLQAAVAELRSERLDALEIAVTAWRQRLEAGIERAPVDELQEWAALRTLAAAVARTGDDGRYLAFEAAQWVTCELAVHLWNVRREHRLANAIFRSLLDEARAVGDTRAEETQRANVACGP